MNDNLSEEIRKIREIAEQHAYSVRQLIGQRTRLLEIINVICRVAEFKSDGDLSAVLGNIEIENDKPQFFQDIFALLLNSGKRDGYFVEFGACDGKFISNTLFLERQFGWQGILAEPSVKWHDDLKRNRPSSKIDTRCVWSETGHRVLFCEFAGDEFGTESAIANNELNSSKLISKKYEVETVSLFDLLRQHNAPRCIDFLSIDVEGGEYEILRNFTFEEYEFEFITVEHEHLTELQKREIKDLLEKYGYTQIFRAASGHDGFYVPLPTKDKLDLC